jgi:hypothetical protein
MALGHTFYHASIRKMVIIMGNLFNNINVRRFAEDGSEIERFRVPISYGPKQKFLARLEAGSNDQNSAITLPRMAFEMDTMTYDPERKQNSLNVIKQSDGAGAVKYSYAPVPYNFDFSLYIMVKNAEDGTQILEQILPYFTPHFNVIINEFPDLGIKKDIPVILGSISQEDVYEGDFEARRAIIWTLTFTLKSNIYGSVREGKIVTSAAVATVQQTPEMTGTEGVTATNQTLEATDPNGLETGDFGFTETREPGDDL